MVHINEQHIFGGILEDAETGALTSECRDCGHTVGGDKPVDLWDAADWAGSCQVAISVAASHLGDQVSGFNTPFSALGGVS